MPALPVTADADGPAEPAAAITQMLRCGLPPAAVTWPEIVPPTTRWPSMPVVVLPARTVTSVAAVAEDLPRYHCSAYRVEPEQG